MRLPYDSADDFPHFFVLCSFGKQRISEGARKYRIDVLSVVFFILIAKKFHAVVTDVSVYVQRISLVASIVQDL